MRRIYSNTNYSEQAGNSTYNVHNCLIPGRRRHFITRGNAMDVPEFEVSPSPEPRGLSSGSCDGVDGTRSPYSPTRHNSTGNGEYATRFMFPF